MSEPGSSASLSSTYNWSSDTMTDMMTAYVMTFCVAIKLVGLALTTQEFRRMSNLRNRAIR
jgi:hypothetical protein